MTLIAVTKRVEPREARVLYDLGERDFGESRPQELWRKYGRLPDDVRWHMIGHLQTNKVRRTLPMVSSVHSLDRWPLAELLSNEAVRVDGKVPVTVQVNLTGEAAKHGFSHEDVRGSYARMIELPAWKSSV